MESGDRSFTVTSIKKSGRSIKTDGGRYISKKVKDPKDISRGKQIIHYEYTTKVKAL